MCGRWGVLSIIEALASGAALPKTLAPLALSDVHIGAPPLPKPRRNIFCVGKNYFAHAREFAGSGFDSSAAAGDIPKVPIYFSKVPESVIGPNATIEIPVGVSDAIDYEVELAVIIGKGGKGITAKDAMQHVWGYTIINDVTARDWQSRHSQWLLGKSFDTFCPMGRGWSVPTSATAATPTCAVSSTANCARTPTQATSFSRFRP
ncbi:MAG: fumarylacetoacetate hydrolase family protein [Rhodoferax sp.]|nr:fumarylacetoacetate hydrolase family protein [Rhodoferax sp.]